MQEIKELKRIIPGKRAVLCDLWGVLHNGFEAFPGAIRALSQMMESNIFLILLSNSPKPGKIVRGQISNLGIGEGLYNSIVTSGDLAREFLGKTKEKSFFHLGPERDQPTIEGLANPQTTDLRAADFIFCTGFFKDWGYNPKQYEAFLSAGIERHIPFICANPDLEVDIGETRMLCAGALAETYENLGGLVHWLGKPKAIAYQKCFEILPKGVGPGDILAIGDNLETDILGASTQGIESLFITSGLHGNHGSTKEELEPFMKTLNIWPDYFMTRLDW